MAVIENRGRPNCGLFPWEPVLPFRPLQFNRERSGFAEVGLSRMIMTVKSRST